ncbi:Ig-like domain-containing alpha-2-macroglobulin family protein [Vallitalea okinawensis]|uniref:Ig-like domain-containing alpha-2-macroglobulin family protein n=1 Tax=Vallitalea okinawensis TaxID=2078660 RepID=UPI000CFAB79C|nr:Ig-like domain-containing alpha-2-macroglobulin family protein [Vallitalea okinawensis]
MKKRIVSVVLVCALLITAIYSNSFNSSIEVKAEAFRNGYTLIPQEQDSTGISTKSTFLLQSEEEKIALEQIDKELTINPEIEFTVSEQADGFLITLEKELEKNKLYTFKFLESTWTFQTTADFKLLGTLPRTETSNVPVNTGIELYFSHYGAEVEDYFEIEPNVSGKFEEHGNVVVFVPNALKEKTIYTITLKAGLSLAESEQSLEEDYTFTFETAAKDESEYTEPKGYFNFSNMMNEFGTDEVPKIPMNYYVYNDKYDDSIKTNVYAYKSMNDFIEAIDKFSETPSWSYFGVEENKIATEGLDEVMSFEQPINQERSYQQFLDLPEGLPEGYYLVDCTWEDIQFQTFIQVTDLSFYYMESIDGSLLWINDLKSDKPVNSATVSEVGTDNLYTSNDDGIVEINNQSDQNEKKTYTIEANGHSAVLLTYRYYYYGTNQSDMYWKYFQTDRNLYQPDDKVKFWGFMQHRYEDEKIDEVTVEIGQGGWWYWDFLPYFGQEMPYVIETFKVENGFYNGELSLPNLEQGGYQLTIKHKDEIISSTYIEVENYVKPAYKIEVTKDKEAIFVGEEVNFEVSTMFYEGTPVANLDVNYNIGGMDYKEGVTTTDLLGKSVISFTPKYNSGYQDIVFAYANAYARLPESGQIYADETIRVFVNDIHVNIDAKIEDNKGFVTAQVNEIDLERINNGTAENDYDFLSNSVEGQKITGVIYKNEWKKREVGQYYDFINKEVKKQYDYYKETTKLQDIVLVTDQEGKAQVEINLPEDKNCYYTAELMTTDLSGKKMTFDPYFSEPWSYDPYDYDYYMLQSEKEEYNVDEMMAIQFVKGEEALGEGNYLYVTAQNGIKDYDVTDSSSYSKVFDLASIPNVEVKGIYFNGKTYIESDSFIPRLNFEKNRIIFTAETDKSTYKPGEEVTVNLKAQVYSDEMQRLVDAKDVMVNVSIVDEALFELWDQNVDTLQELYRWIGGGINSTYASHSNSGNNMIEPMYYGLDMAKSDVMEDAAVRANYSMVTKESSAEVYVRSEFKDTAIFETVYLDEKGEGTLTFKLPDNVTAWRMTMAGISETLQAGSNIEELKVTLPYFISTNINSTYLVGDQPFIGVTTYGNELKEGEAVHYEVTCEETGYVTTAEGKAFERVNIPLWEMEEGNYHITVKAVSESGYSDGLKEEINVVKTYHKVEAADYYDLEPGLTVKTNDAGMTSLTFVDQGKGLLMPTLYSLAYNSGKRVDQKYLAYKARDILMNSYGMEFYENEEVVLEDYQVDDGGYAILPYSESDVETTVKLLPVIKEDTNTLKVKMYLYNELNNEESRNRAAALYGLALLGEPVLLQAETLEQISNLTFKEEIYLALAFAELGDLYKAKALYKNEIQGYVETYDNVARVQYGHTEDSYLEYTALVMMLASQLDLEEKELFFDYVTHAYSKEILVNAELMVYVGEEIGGLADEELKVSYIYDGEDYEKNVKNGWAVTVKVPSIKLKDFKITDVEGEAALVAVYDKEIVSNQKDEDLKVTRTYMSYSTGEVTNDFEESDIVKVKIDWDIAKTAIDNAYTITDFAPSGLKPIDNPWEIGLKTGNGYWYRDIDGQRVTFHVYKNTEEYQPLYYYARVVTPGTYNAEGVIIQGSKVKDSMCIGESDQVTIKK